MNSKKMALAFAATVLLLTVLAASCNEAPQEQPVGGKTAAVTTPANTAAGTPAVASTDGSSASGSDCGGDCSDDECSQPSDDCGTCPKTAEKLTGMACDEKIVLAVDGMTCGSCEKKIGNTLAKVDGVTLGAADQAESKVWVAFDPQVANVEVISAAISGLGFTVGDELERVGAMAGLAEGHERTAVYVDQLGCGDCTGRINDALGGIDGVQASAVDREFKIVFIDYDPAQLSPAAFKTAILDAGYAAALPGEVMAEPENPHCNGCTGEEKSDAA